MKDAPVCENQNAYVRPEMYELGDAAKLTEGGGSDTWDSESFKLTGIPAAFEMTDYNS